MSDFDESRAEYAASEDRAGEPEPAPEAPAAPPAEAIPPRPVVIFEDLTLAEMLRYFVWRPRQTTRLLWNVLARDPAYEQEHPARGDEPPGDDEPPSSYLPPEAGMLFEDDLPAEPPFPITAGAPLDSVAPGLRHRAAAARVAVLALALLLAILGGKALHDASLDLSKHARRATGAAAFWFVLSGALVVGFEGLAQGAALARRFPRLAARLRDRFGREGMAYVWTLGLGMGVIALLGAALIVGSPPAAALLLGLAALLWGIIVLGNAPQAALDEREVIPAALAPPAAPAPLVEESEEGSVYRIRSRVSEAPPPAVEPIAPRGVSAWVQRNALRLVVLPIALVASLLAYSENVQRSPLGEVTDIVLTAPGVIAWGLSIVLWVIVLGPEGTRAAPRRARWAGIGRRLRGESGLTLLALAGILALGAWFRLHDLASTPPEMTSDHIEKLLDALRVHDGYHAVFFPNNGGREGFQMYFVAFLAWLGMGFSFDTLKVATVIEGLMTLPALWWMARQIVGTATARQREWGNWIGLALAGLVAVSAWHVMLSRLGLRIVLTPLTTALALGFLARLMRDYRRGDALALGFVLGAGTYFYQANRMLPLVVGAGIVLALLSRVRRPADALRLLGDGLGLGAVILAPLLVYLFFAERESGGRLEDFLPLFVMVWFSLLALIVLPQRANAVFQAAGSLLLVVVVALAVYLPMYHYSRLFPDQFWNRTRGRMFGEDAFVRPDPATGALVAYEPTIREQAERLWQQRDVFVQNYRDALRMYHWEGDAAWINNPFGRPALPAVTGGLLILGIVMWGLAVLHRPDPVWWLLPVAVLVMLLPSALTVAYTIENPSFTRASGTIPPVFMIAALPLGTLGWRLARLPRPALRGWHLPLGAAAALLVLAGVFGGALRPDWDQFFTDYRLHYLSSWKPYTLIAQPLREFARGEGRYGNAFMIAYPHWLDHRILGTMAGDIRWPNGLVTREDVFSRVTMNRGTPYQFDPSRPAFFMYNSLDTETADWLAQTFPGGTTEHYSYSYTTDLGQQTDGFEIYRVRVDGLLS